MLNYQEHVISDKFDARKALKTLDDLPSNARRVLFILSFNGKLEGTLTDGDIRRGLLSGAEISQSVNRFINKKFSYLKDGEDFQEKIKEFKKQYIFMIPVLDQSLNLIEILDLRKTKTLLPVSAVIMAGGRGERLKPLTDNKPKPMLLVGNKPIIEHNIDRLISFGIKQIYITVKYLKEQIMEYFGDGSQKGISIKYIQENEPLGTIGSLAYIDDFEQENILVMNSDLLTNIDFEDFYAFFKQKKADMLLASIPYEVNIPYAVLKTDNFKVQEFSEKPTYTYYSNGGIYLFNANLKSKLIKGMHYNATDLMATIIEEDDKSLVHFPLLGYWLDIGKHQDYLKAQEDVKRLHL